MPEEDIKQLEIENDDSEMFTTEVSELLYLPPTSLLHLAVILLYLISQFVFVAVHIHILKSLSIPSFSSQRLVDDVPVPSSPVEGEQGEPETSPDHSISTNTSK